MDKVFDFYSNLFSIEITVFGILIAAVFVIVQLVYSSFSYQPLKYILKSNWLKFYLFLSALSLLLTAGATYILALENHNFIPKYDFQTDAFLSHPVTLLISLILFIVSIIVFGILIVQNFKLLRPSEIVSQFTFSINYEEIRKYLLKKFGVPEPRKKSKIPTISVNFVNGKEGKELVGELIHENLNKSDQEGQFQKDYTKYEKLKAEVSQITDPIAPLIDLAVQAIKKTDFRTLAETKEAFLKIFQTFLTTFPELDNETKWNPYSGTRRNFVEYFLEILNSLLEVSKKESLISTELITLEISKNISHLTVNNLIESEKTLLFNFWKRIADDAIGRSSTIFKKVISYFREEADILFDKSEKSSLDNIFRILGWLGERLLSKTVVEDRPLMAEYEYSSEYDELLDCILSYGFKYNTDHPDWYPLIYFDAVDVLLQKVIVQFSNGVRTHDLKDHIFSLINVFASFSESAIKVGNNEGAELAVIRTYEAYKILEDAGQDELAQECIKLLVQTAIVAAGNKDKLTKISFLHQRIEDWIGSKLVSNPYQEAISAQIFDSYLRSSLTGNREEIWAYVKELGSLLATNFGLMFDPVTQDDYSDNDPRR